MVSATSRPRSHEDAAIVVNESLRESIRRHRREQLAFFQDVQRELKRVRPGAKCKHGRSASERSLFVRRDADPHLGALIARFEACLPEYAVKRIEIWLGGPQATPRHNDAALYVQSGRAVVLQFWVLLEACLLADPTADAPNDKNALECLVPCAPGIVFPGMSTVLTPREGHVEYRPHGVVGGDDMAIGDMLVFKNGVIHEAHGSDRVFRAAFAFRAFLKRYDDPEDIDFMLWVREAVRRDPNGDRERDPSPVGRQASNPYFLAAEKAWRKLPERPCDPARLYKIDRNDHAGLRRRLAEFDFSY